MIDEFQYVPELPPFIKMIVDERNEMGLYFLTGSQLFKMMNRDLFFSSYVQTYIERDIRKVVNVRDVGRFCLPRLHAQEIRRSR